MIYLIQFGDCEFRNEKQIYIGKLAIDQRSTHYQYNRQNIGIGGGNGEGRGNKSIPRLYITKVRTV